MNKDLRSDLVYFQVSHSLWNDKPGTKELLISPTYYCSSHLVKDRLRI